MFILKEMAGEMIFLKLSSFKNVFFMVEHMHFDCCYIADGVSKSVITTSS